MSGHSQKTDLVHFGYDSTQHHHAANPPIYLSSTFEFDSAEACADAFQGQPREGQTHIYSRISNPTTEIFEARIAKVEKGEAGLAAASGIGIISSIFWTFLSQGATLVASNRIYGCTYALIQHQLTRFGVNVVFVDMTDLEAVKLAVKDLKNVKMLYTESIQNPTNDVVDIEALAAISKQLGARLVIDNTFATPIGMNPLTMGADIVLHSATKYIIGGIFTAGCAVGKKADMDQVRFIGIKDCTGAVIDPMLSFNMIYGLETLDVRVTRMSENCIKLAKFLESNNKVEKVICTGLESHPQYELCKKQIRIPNSILTIYLKGGYEECCKVINGLKLTLKAVSLGKTHSLANHPASMTHSPYSKEERAKYGISDNMIRISVGVEDIVDIIEDWSNALKME